MRNLLGFYVLLGFLLFVSCGEKAKKDEGPRPQQTNETLYSKVEQRGVILFFGTSLTAGMGLDSEEAFPAVIQQKIDSLDLGYEVVNAGLSGETSAAGKNRIGWVLKQKVDVFVLEIGANDGLRGVPIEETRKNLQAIIDTVRAKGPDTEIILAGMQIPPNMGQAYATEFRELFPSLAQENDLYLISFLLEDVGGNPKLNQQDGIHPTAEGQKILARNVWEVLYPVISK
ncbi:arylesterase [Antarcticibacterium arcticum]|uniref:Arylesterase n=1 Tax=Antarcticibacterium arcticum TaxID=2585771 RepID=A0A5B8YF84_9FLAO|nr:arylesterase [Antarcticibacterium arcticum]QED36632.1 arylesterase [Antarcticibacterium arcticum]